ncbi:hypothetical protein [Klebsiella phage vB_KshKPC-M]|nr:hypothetical protein [Klebsiella phage vB_KshKPC-M]
MIQISRQGIQPARYRHSCCARRMRRPVLQGWRQVVLHWRSYDGWRAAATLRKTSRILRTRYRGTEAAASAIRFLEQNQRGDLKMNQ